MSKLRPECKTYNKAATLTREQALIRIRDAVMRRRSLCYGQLHDDKGHYCAMGAFWKDNPGERVPSSLTDEIAAINDAVVPSLSYKDRWRVVKSWLVEQVGW